MSNQNYKEKTSDLWDYWENDGFSEKKADITPLTKESTHQDNVRLWKEANQRAPDVEIMNASRTAYKPSLKILQRCTNNSNNLSASNKSPEMPHLTEPEQGHYEKEQRYREVRQKIFGVSTLENKSYAPIRPSVSSLSERESVRGRGRI